MLRDSYTIEDVAYVDGGNDHAAEARLRFKSEIPGMALRRMTHLGMLTAYSLKQVNLSRELPIVYASAFAESESLEVFLDSFPTASPAMFQKSIHPSAVEQALIARKQVVDRFYPITSNYNLAGQAIEHCFILGESSVLLVGGEEKGTWLCPFELASDQSFAFALKLGSGSSGLGTVAIDRETGPSEITPMGFPEFAKALAARDPVKLPAFALGACIDICW